MQTIIKELEKITSFGYPHYQVFQDFLDLSLYSFLGDDVKYLEIVKKYEKNYPIGKRPIDYFANALGNLMSYMQKTNNEILGELYMTWNMNNKYKGQFFTPFHIAEMMALITKPTGGTICDPSCGSGVMLVASAKTMTNEQLDNAVFFGQDIDPVCVKMTALNMLFFNLNGYAVQGNTLAYEVNEVYETRRSYFGGSIYKMKDLEKFKEYYLPRIEKVVINEQMSIF